MSNTFIKSEVDCNIWQNLEINQLSPQITWIGDSLVTEQDKILALNVINSGVASCQRQNFGGMYYLNKKIIKYFTD